MSRKTVVAMAKGLFEVVRRRRECYHGATRPNWARVPVRNGGVTQAKQTGKWYLHTVLGR